MKLRRAHGFGGLEVYLLDGVHIEGSGDDETVAYDDLDGLTAALGRAIAMRNSDMRGAEARYLRKRLDMSQADLGALGGKTDQVAAKWEKEQLPVPKAEANLLRLCWLQRFSPTDVSRRIERLAVARQRSPARPYEFHLHAGKWSELQQPTFAMTTRQTTETVGTSLQVPVDAQNNVAYASGGLLELGVKGARLAIAAVASFTYDQRAFV